MVNELYRQQKQSLGFSKKAVKRAGDTIRKGSNESERKQAIEIIRNFRGSHLYPLMLIKNHVNRFASKVADDFILTRRLKRLPTILDKLARPTLDGQSSNAIQLTRMQDIGGCRIIFDTIEQVYDCLERLKKSRSVHKIIKIEDRMQAPKFSGYRGVHVVFSCYENGGDETNPWYKHKIELQLRTKTQHAWATCVETIDIFAQTRLKTTMDGNEEYRQFFKLASDLMTETEFPGFIPSGTKLDSLKVFIELEEKCNFITELENFHIVTKTVGFDGSDSRNLNGQMLIWMSRNEADENVVYRKYFAPAKNAEAVQAYNQLEEELTVDLVVLIAVKQVVDIKKAYPNYYADTSLFAEFVINRIKEANMIMKTQLAMIKKELEMLKQLREDTK